MSNKDKPANPTPYAELSIATGGCDELYCDELGFTKREIVMKDFACAIASSYFLEGHSVDDIVTDADRLTSAYFEKLENNNE